MKKQKAKQSKKAVKKVIKKKVAKKKPAVKKVVKKAVKKVAKKKMVAPKKKGVSKKATPKKIASKKATPKKKAVIASSKKETFKKAVIISNKKLVRTIKKQDPNKTRYSDDELQEFKEVILKKMEQATKDLQMLMAAYTNSNEHDTSDTSPTFKVLEEGNQVLSKEENSQLAARQSKFIKSLENALIRIENKTYGICRETGKLISKERLMSVPHATLSIDAKLQQHKR